MARFVSPLISKYKLSPTPFIVINKSGGAGAEGFMYVKGKKADPHLVIITLSNLFTTPLATGVPFNWKDLTPLATIDDERIALPEWDRIPTIKEAVGVELSYMMLRGIFGAPGITKDQQAFYADVLKKVTETPEWKTYISDNGLKAVYLTGPDYVKWVAQQETIHKDLMTKGD